jgi:hypothetical protein
MEQEWGTLKSGWSSLEDCLCRAAVSPWKQGEKLPSLSLSLKISSQPNDFVLEELLRTAHNIVAITPISTPTEEISTSLKIEAL